MAEKDIEGKSEALCSGVYSVFASTFGTKPIPSHASTNSKHKQHNRELKKLRKQKITAQRALRAAQREHKCVEDQRRLGLEYRQIVRQYHTALKKKRSARKTDISRVRKECARSFWKFVSKILDDDQTASNSKPSFDGPSAQSYFTRVYASDKRAFNTPF